MDMNLSKLWEIAKDREARSVVVHGVIKSWTWVSNWTTKETLQSIFSNLIALGLTSSSVGTSLVAQMVKCLPTMRETRVQSLGWEDLLEKAMATHSSILAWKIPWTEEPGRLQSMGSQRVGHDWATSLSLFSSSVTAIRLENYFY